jgi:hypothetical protein
MLSRNRLDESVDDHEDREEYCLALCHDERARESVCVLMLKS